MATLVSNTTVFNKHDYVQKMRERLRKPQTWRDIMDVRFSDVRTIVTGALTTEPAVQTDTPGDQYTYQAHVIAQDTLTLSTHRILPSFIEEPYRFEQSYISQMEMAERHGEIIGEYLEAQMLAQHSSWTDFGATDLSNTGDDDTATITVSATNIDDLIRAIKRKQNANNGVDLAVKFGRYVVWRASDMELLEAFVQANGFTEADIALKNGIPVERAFRYMGVDNYLSTQHTANHLMAGIKKTATLGILRGTWGQVKTIEDPDRTSGLGLPSRVDYGWDFHSTTSLYKEFFMDINVA